MKQASLFARAEPQPALLEAKPLRVCEGCAKLSAPRDEKLAGLGLMQCALDGPATFKSVHQAGGQLRQCDKGLSHADTID